MLSEERLSELNWCWAAETSDVESQEWRANLSEEEAALVAKWDEDYACGLTKLYGEMLRPNKRNSS